MPVYVTFHLVENYENTVVPALSSQKGDSETLAVGASSVESSIPTVPRLARIHATEECRLKIGRSADADANSEFWPAGSSEVRFVDAGENISVKAP